MCDKTPKEISDAILANLESIRRLDKQFTVGNDLPNFLQDLMRDAGLMYKEADKEHERT